MPELLPEVVPPPAPPELVIESLRGVPLAVMPSVLPCKMWPNKSEER